MEEPKQHRWQPKGSPQQRGYGAAHRRIRQELLKSDPSCRMCGEPGKVADHIQPMCLGGITAIENMQILCPACSATKSGREGAHMRWQVHRRHMDRGNGPGGRK